MIFEVIPAIDVAAGRLAMFGPGGPTPVQAHGGDPLTAARAYVDAGVRWLHVVDMDLAFHGEMGNLDLVRAVAALGVRVQASGGARRPEELEAWLGAGARRAVLGSGALADEAATSAAIARFADRLVVGIDVDGGRIRARGRSSVDLPLAETLGWLVACGASAFLVTAVSRVGRLSGPDTAAVKRVVGSGRPVIAAGGVSSIDDLRSLRRAGAAGAIVGRAALEGDLDLADALALA
jgi:phosphoribosylformimino-5-aminoimidazole carboxamide ribonucleotide (ProFAR) isomerase